MSFGWRVAGTSSNSFPFLDCRTPATSSGDQDAQMSHAFAITFDGFLACVLQQIISKFISKFISKIISKMKLFTPTARMPEIAIRNAWLDVPSLLGQCND
jgi:hypothetical protein